MARSKSGSKKQKRKDSKERQQQQQVQVQFKSTETDAIATVTTENLFWPSHAKDREEILAVNGENYDDDDSDEDGVGFSDALDSIVKIHCTHSEPDYLIPWQKQHQSTSTSSGFVISLLPSKDDDNDNDPESLLRIMTNAHSVEYGSIVQVQKRGQEHKYEAIVEHIANECDLAILKIVMQDDEPDFFLNDPKEDADYDNGDSTPTRVQPLTLSSSLPELQEEVDVLGYPTGGDSLSVTTGVVSRIEMQEYTQANTNLLAMQVDAAINPGNSGGPVVNEDLEVIGVAFQGLDEAQNIGYVVPVTVVNHLLHDIQRHGQYTGFCSMGASFVWLQNKAFRNSLGMIPSQQEPENGNHPKKALSGVMVKEVAPLSPCKGILLPSDVILQVDGIPLANDGKVPFRPGERVSLTCYIQTKFMGDVVQLQVLRKGQIQEQLFECPVEVMKRLVPPHFHNQPPPYLIVAGLVFTVLSIPYLLASSAWDEFQSDHISYLLGKTNKPLERPSDQFVILSQVLAHRENLGYDKLGDLQLDTLNGQKIRSLHHLKSLIDDRRNEKEEPFLTFRFQPDNQVVVLDRSRVQQATEEVCQEQAIQHSFFIPPSSRTTGNVDPKKRRGQGWRRKKVAHQNEGDGNA